MADEVAVAKMLSSLPPFQDWSHQPMPAEMENALLGLDEQELMTAAAVCLIRVMRLRDTSAEAA